MPKLPPRPCSEANSRPHPCGRTCGAVGPQGPQPAAAAPTPPHPEAATSQASASASAGTRKMLARVWALARTQTVGNPRTSAPGPLLPTCPSPHLSGGIWAAEAREARFRQGASLRLRQEALAVQRGLDKACVAVELHQVEDLRNVHQGGKPESHARSPGLAGPQNRASLPPPGPRHLLYLSYVPSLALHGSFRYLPLTAPCHRIYLARCPRPNLSPSPLHPTPFRLSPWVWPRLCSTELPS